MAKTSGNWYTSWFDTPYYHILYKDRDYAEAEGFMDKLITKLALKKGAEILDLACGKGRHSIYLNKLGFDVTGIDLSRQSIAQAKKHEKPGLEFHVHNMCKPLSKDFDAVFNLFTSFGYFKDEEDNLETLKAIKKELKPGGYGVIDFMNVRYVEDRLVPQETKTINGITFHLKRWLEDGFIMKQIDFEDKDRRFSHIEKVKALTLSNFKTFFEKANLKLVHTFGDYQLNDFDIKSSERLILVVQ